MSRLIHVCRLLKSSVAFKFLLSMNNFGLQTKQCGPRLYTLFASEKFLMGQQMTHSRRGGRVKIKNVFIQNERNRVISNFSERRHIK